MKAVLGAVAPVRLAEQHEVDGVHEGDVRVGAAHAVAEAPLDGELAEAVELRALGGRELVAVVARDERALLHACVGTPGHFQS